MSHHDIRVRREAADGLSAQQWSFWLDEGTMALVVSKYTPYSRPSHKHRLRPCDGAFDCFDYRSTVHADTVPLPDDVVGEAVDQLRRAIHVRRHQLGEPVQAAATIAARR